MQIMMQQSLYYLELFNKFNNPIDVFLWYSIYDLPIISDQFRYHGGCFLSYVTLSKELNDWYQYSEHLKTLPLIHDQWILLSDKLILHTLAWMDKLKFQKIITIYFYLQIDFHLVKLELGFLDLMDKRV